MAEAPFFPPMAEAQQMAADIQAMVDRYPFMWEATRDKLGVAAESLRWQIHHGYVRAEDR